MAKPHKKLAAMDYALRAVFLFVLVFVLLPVVMDPNFNLLYIGNRNNFRRTACQSNLKQLSLALVQYSQDNNELLPPPAVSDGHGWREAVYPFVKSAGIYRCPEDKRDGSKDAPDHLPKSYAWNSLCLSSSKKGVAVYDLLPTAVLAADTRGFDGEEWNMTGPTFLPGTGRELYAHLPRHIFYEHPKGTINCLYADGHVKAMPPMATLTPINLWTTDGKPFTGKDLANAQAILKNAENE